MSINLPGKHFSWNWEEGPDSPRSAFLGLPCRRFYQDKIPACFNAELGQFPTGTTPYTSNSRGLGNITQKVLSIIFVRNAYLVNSLSCNWCSIAFELPGLPHIADHRKNGKGLVLSPGCFLACFIAEISEPSSKPVSIRHVQRDSYYPPCLWGMGQRLWVFLCTVTSSPPARGGERSLPTPWAYQALHVEEPPS